MKMRCLAAQRLEFGMDSYTVARTMREEVRRIESEYYEAVKIGKHAAASHKHKKRMCELVENGHRELARKINLQMSVS